MKPIIEVHRLSKSYRLGQRGFGSLRDSFQFWWKETLKRKNTQEAPELPGAFWALRDISFQVQEGQAIGLLGKNGAGKSTLLKILASLTEPSEGHAVIRGRLASLLEVGSGFHPDLTGRENIFLNGAFLGMKKKEVARQFDAIVDFFLKPPREASGDPKMLPVDDQKDEDDRAKQAHAAAVPFAFTISHAHLVSFPAPGPVLPFQ